MNLVLVKMFVAILDGHYYICEAENETNSEKINFLARMVVILREENDKIYSKLKKVTE